MPPYGSDEDGLNHFAFRHTSNRSIWLLLPGPLSQSINGPSKAAVV